MEELNESQKKYAIISLSAFALVGVMLWGSLNFIGGGEVAAIRSISENPPQVPVESVFDKKIVYTTDMSFSEDALRGDCRQRRGVFNACGSPCIEGSECASVCAYTCQVK